MKLLEKKELLPLDFLTSSVSQGWNEVGTLKASLEGIKQTFSGTDKVEKIIQELIDAYLIYIGQLELLIDKKDYLELPDEKDLKAPLSEDLEIAIKPEADKVTLDIKPTESADTIIEPSKEEPIILEPATTTSSTIDGDPFEYFCDFEDPIISKEEISPYQAWIK